MGYGSGQCACPTQSMVACRPARRAQLGGALHTAVTAKGAAVTAHQSSYNNVRQNDYPHPNPNQADRPRADPCWSSTFYPSLTRLSGAAPFSAPILRMHPSAAHHLLGEASSPWPAATSAMVASVPGCACVHAGGTRRGPSVHRKGAGTTARTLHSVTLSVAMRW
eukprot:scaffold3043_cov360-Prasinococcus_capsulatus_cf.AAC.10